MLRRLQKLLVAGLIAFIPSAAFAQSSGSTRDSAQSAAAAPGDSGLATPTGSEVTAAGRWDLDRDPYLLETSAPGVLACGDVRYGPVKRVASAVGEGSMAIAFVHQFLREAEPDPVAESA